MFESSYKVWVGPFLVYVVRDPEDIQTALNSDECFEKPAFYRQYFSYGMVVMGGDEYKLHRRITCPMFNPSALLNYLPKVNKKMNNFLKRFDEKLDSEEVDFCVDAADFTLDTALSTLFGVENSDEAARKKLVEDGRG